MYLKTYSLVNKLFCCITLYLLLFCSCNHIQEQRDFPLDDILEGDLAFRCGQGMFSRAVTIAEESGIYSHVGILVQQQGNWRVIHSVPGEREGDEDFDRVKSEELEAFFSKKRAIKGCLVHTGLEDSTIIKVLCHNAIDALIDSVKFDNEYNTNDTSKVYCTEFIWRLYSGCGIDLSEGRRKYIKAFNIQGDVILPEHILNYSGNRIYYRF